MARTRWTLLVLWMAVYGVGVVPNKDIMAAARRIRVS
jgi:1,3-beta-glucan synthase